ncbi:hypothetical protein CUMW_275850 [Citrus unshiu]|uniref:Uncharacterized protein n=2 Tax=Citrus TaxID=2706 RepID=A0A067D2Y3_CITSI|nr:hypothetical protein CISIN_1g037070mg [Citrus sinensis]GAY33633.1 hypothetical protein CUMW_275850 [Citrus unshiu]
MLLQGERANWIDPTYRKYFIDLCMREANNGNRIWGNLEAYCLEHDFLVTENIDGKIYYPETTKKWMGLYERQYLTWLKLTMATRHGYNSTTRTFDWPFKRWEEYLKKYPKAKQFRNRPLVIKLFSSIVGV